MPVISDEKTCTGLASDSLHCAKDTLSSKLRSMLSTLFKLLLTFAAIALSGYLVLRFMSKTKTEDAKKKVRELQGNIRQTAEQARVKAGEIGQKAREVIGEGFILREVLKNKNFNKEISFLMFTFSENKFDRANGAANKGSQGSGGASQKGTSSSGNDTTTTTQHEYNLREKVIPVTRYGVDGEERIQEEEEVTRTEQPHGRGGIFCSGFYLIGIYKFFLEANI